LAKTVGILSLQGCVEPHADHLRALGVEVRHVYKAEDLRGIQGLILPGGESTTMLKLAMEWGLWEPLQKAAKEIPFWGICAGSILMAKEVENPQQPSLGVMDIKVRRNAYGRQVDSFQQSIELTGGEKEEAPAVFIRAPKFVSWGPSVKVAGQVNGESVYLEEGRHMVTAFHPELTDSHWAHRRFLSKL
jgi:pyridoxal 5'-phosphate synthase pdxT subunit